MIIKTTFSTILQIWQTHLWPERKSKIESHSAMLLDRTYDLKNFNYIPSYFIYIVDNKIIGCNSGHKCFDNTYRSRGLFVFPEYRGHGYGNKLLLETVKQAKIERADSIWSYPKKSSWNTYKKAKFKLISDWEKSENDTNAYCIRKF